MNFIDKIWQKITRPLGNINYYYEETKPKVDEFIRFLKDELPEQEKEPVFFLYPVEIEYEPLFRKYRRAIHENVEEADAKLIEIPLNCADPVCKEFVRQIDQTLKSLPKEKIRDLDVDEEIEYPLLVSEGEGRGLYMVQGVYTITH